MRNFPTPGVRSSGAGACPVGPLTQAFDEPERIIALAKAINRRRLEFRESQGHR
jgi:hypothetical protein